MGDEFNINSVKDFYANFISETEISDISKIIKQMINIKSSNQRLPCKKTKPYDIVDKIKLNNISKNVALKIKKYHIESYDIVDDAIKCLEEYDLLIRKDLYDYYWDVYIDILINLKIDNDDCDTIKNNVDEIYLTLLKKIREQLFLGKKTDIPTNKIITYIEAITSYVFYKCKFLIPIEDTK